MDVHQVILSGEKCALVNCSVDDAGLWAKWDNDLRVTLPLGDEAYTLTSIDKELENIKNILQNQSPVFGILDCKSGRLIGRCMLFDIDRVNRSAMMGIVIGETDFWGLGYGQEATRLLLEYGFQLLNLNSIILGVFEYNQRAVACYKKVGFKEIGRRREARIIGEKKYDAILMDILASEFHSTRIQKIPGEFIPEMQK
jgi:RimJ/RimL family protein N-acetyltransferase